MPRPIHVVYSVPPDGVRDDAYSEYYEMHVAEILETPGFVAARRYWLEPAVPNRPPSSTATRPCTCSTLRPPRSSGDACRQAS
jgi:hypothetical protein